MITAKVIADSISVEGSRITTIQVKFHRFILPEFNTHRVFSRNFSSSRAIPAVKLLEQVRKDPAMPVHFGKNQSGMQAMEELTGAELQRAKDQWCIAALEAADNCEKLSKTGVHKQICNRVLEPFLWVNGIVTATEWDNFFELRAHPDAQPEIQALAVEIQKAMGASTPTLLQFGEWHLPYVSAADQSKIGDIELCKKVSAARCCRVSYLKHDGTAADIEDDLALFNKLMGSVPQHSSPTEHQATPDTRDKDTWNKKHLHGNLVGWVQHRKLIEK